MREQSENKIKSNQLMWAIFFQPQNDNKYWRKTDHGSKNIRKIIWIHIRKDVPALLMTECADAKIANSTTQVWRQNAILEIAMCGKKEGMGPFYQLSFGEVLLLRLALRRCWQCWVYCWGKHTRYTVQGTPLPCLKVHYKWRSWRHLRPKQG